MLPSEPARRACVVKFKNWKFIYKMLQLNYCILIGGNYYRLSVGLIVTDFLLLLQNYSQRQNYFKNVKSFCFSVVIFSFTVIL